MAIPIVELFGQVVEYARTHDAYGRVTAPIDWFYFKGHRQEISNRLTVLGKDVINKAERYPLIAVRMDIPERVYDGITHVSLNVFMAATTSKTDWVDDRYEKVFKPVLYPRYDRLMAAIKNSGLFFWDGDQEAPQHIKIDRPYYGVTGPEANQANYLNDPVDAIEIIDLKLSTFIKTCQ
jgi:hypothetical protein